ncbi:MAG: HAMP domain-containing sensor histidine kinase [Polyangiales bacterium]
MAGPSRGLLLRIYVVIGAQVLLVAGTIAMVGFLSFKPTFRWGWGREATYVVNGLRDALDSPEALRAELARVHLDLGATLALFKLDGSLIASNVPTPPEATPEELDAVVRDTRIAGHARDGSGGKPMPRFVMLLDKRAPERGYAIYLAKPPPPPPFDRTLLTLLVGLIAAAIASVVLARSFVKPLAELTTLARTLGSGDLTARARSRRGDEFGQLARAFDDMAERLTLVLQSQQELLANVSHELRTPLARIRVALDLAAEGDAAMAQEAVGEITTDLTELERLVSDVLQTAKLDLAAGRAGQALPLLRTKLIAASDLVDQAVARFRSVHPGRELTLERDDADLSLTGDPVLLRRALDNLLDNARAYSDDDKPVRLEAKRTPDGIALSVIDRGIGIAESDLPNVTKPFFRTDPSRARRTGGLGLGLSLARRIVEAHGGRLELESQLGRGTTVRLVLPVATDT